MSPQMGQVAFRIGLYLTVVALVLLFFLRPGSAEFGVTVVTLVVGLIFLGIVIFLVRYFSR
jgi:preprotein translocase subunit Sss1